MSVNNITPQENKDYSYFVDLGPLSFRAQSNYDLDMNRIGCIMNCLQQPDLAPPSMLGSAKRRVRNAKLFLVRFFNYLSTGTWMNEASARKLVKHYSRRPNAQKNPTQLKAIQEVYDRLAKIKRLNGTYVDGIDRMSLEAIQEQVLEKTALDQLKTFACQMFMDPRTQQVAKKLGDLALDALLKIALAYGTSSIEKTKTSALAILQTVKAAVVAKETE